MNLLLLVTVGRVRLGLGLWAIGLKYWLALARHRLKFSLRLNLIKYFYFIYKLYINNYNIYLKNLLVRFGYFNGSF